MPVVVIASPTAIPARPAIELPAHAIGTCTASAATASSGSMPGPPSTNSSGNATESATDTVIQSAGRRRGARARVPVVAAVARAEREPGHRGAGEREHAGRARDHDEREPRGRDDVPRGALGRQVPPAQRHRGDERHRRRRDRDEQRGDEVGVGERRRLARAEPAREAVRDDVEPLDRERAARRPRRAAATGRRRHRPAARHRGGARGARAGCRRRALRSARGPSRTPATPWPTSEHDHDEPGDRADAVPERRGAVVVERGEGARRDPRVDLQHRGRDEPRQQRGGARLRLRVARSAARRPQWGAAIATAASGTSGSARASAQEPTSRPSLPASCARANSGSTTTRSALATSTTAT